MENNNENMLIIGAVYVSDYKVNITFADVQIPEQPHPPIHHKLEIKL